MRLTNEEIHHIKDYVAEVFGREARVYLFGSRVDDTKKGGDIDLFIEADDKTNPLEKASQLWSKLQFALGEQKIDIIMASDPDRLIEKEARRTGKLL